MAPEPRRKDRHAREKPAGLEPVEKEGPPPEEYTGYREVRPEKATDDTAEARREADLQPGTPESERPGRDGEQEEKEERTGEV